MKKLFVLAMMALLLLAPAFTAAGESLPLPVAGKSAVVDYEGTTCKMDFFKGPFGPRDNGITDIYIDGVFWQSLPYIESPEWVVTVENFARFKYTPGELTWIQGPLIVFKVEEAK